MSPSSHLTPFIYNIDVIEGCNLRCPSCPVGNSRDAGRPRGIMSVDMFDQIMDKIAVETPNVQYVGLFSWTEPLLHPQVARIVESVKRHAFPCFLSSNLNRMDTMEDVVRAGPDRLRISVSGFYQDTYGQTHKGGDIRSVKANMYRLRTLLDKHKSTMRVSVGYHRYRHNMGRDYEMMRALARELKFSFEPVWAFLMPLEKVLDYYEHRVSETDQQLIQLLAISPAEHKQLHAGSAPCDCPLRAEQTTINADGSVALCCGVFDQKYNVATNFLQVPFAELQERKYAHSMCHACMSHEMHKTAIMQKPELLDDIGMRNLGRTIPLPQRLGRYLTRPTRQLLRAGRRKLALRTRWRALKRKL